MNSGKYKSIQKCIDTKIAIKIEGPYVSTNDQCWGQIVGKIEGIDFTGKYTAMKCSWSYDDGWGNGGFNYYEILWATRISSYYKRAFLFESSEQRCQISDGDIEIKDCILSSPKPKDCPNPSLPTH